jgi:hypothetical protein
MIRLLLILTTSSVLSGCALFRDPMTVPFDIEIRPKVGLDLEVERTPMDQTQLYWLIGIAFLVGVIVVVKLMRSREE